MDKQLLIAMAHKMPIKAKWVTRSHPQGLEVEVLNQRTADWNKGWFYVQRPDGQRRFAHCNTLELAKKEPPTQEPEPSAATVDASTAMFRVSRCLPFDQLTTEQQEAARRMFFDAQSGDGKKYALDMDGKILYRRRISNVA